MTPLAQLALVAMLSLTPPYREAHVRHWHVQHWRVEVATHRFTGDKSCRLENGPVDYRRHALVFHFPTQVDTSNAIYRVDAGMPRTSQSDLIDLAKLGFSLYAPSLDNPSGGLVRIPTMRLQGASLVWIQPQIGRYPIEFTIAGFAAAMDIARTAGCTEASFDG
jgi:hypothetical protein